MPDESTKQPDTQSSAAQTNTPETFTREQVQEAARKARSDALAESGRYKAEAEKALKAMKAAEERMARMMKDTEEAELAAAKDEPERLTNIRIRGQLRTMEAEREKYRTELEEANARLAETNAKYIDTNRETLVHQIAAQHGVDAAKLAKLARFTDGTHDAIAEIAQDLPRGAQTTAQSNPLRPDSNRSVGGSALTVLEVRQKYISGKLTAPQYAEQMRQLGAQP